MLLPLPLPTLPLLSRVNEGKGSSSKGEKQKIILEDVRLSSRRVVVQINKESVIMTNCILNSPSTIFGRVDALHYSVCASLQLTLFQVQVILLTLIVARLHIIFLVLCA